FQQCLITMKDMPELTSEDEVENLVREFLVHGHELSEMCRIFREYWAISTRNDVIQQYVVEYYQSYYKIIAEKFRPVAVSEKALSQAISIFIPYVEGYSVTASALPNKLDSNSFLIKTVIWKCLKEEF
uniref:TetR/AcrR family transcriptional regulator n=1 Tax=Vibrio sp. TaxID=678 RepID=UPI003D0B7107